MLRLRTPFQPPSPPWTETLSRTRPIGLLGKPFRMRKVTQVTTTPVWFFRTVPFLAVRREGRGPVNQEWLTAVCSLRNPLRVYPHVLLTRCANQHPTTTIALVCLPVCSKTRRRPLPAYVISVALLRNLKCIRASIRGQIPASAKALWCVYNSYRIHPVVFLIPTHTATHTTAYT